MRLLALLAVATALVPGRLPGGHAVSGSVSVVSRARGPIDVHGRRAASGSLPIGDATAGLRYPVP